MLAQAAHHGHAEDHESGHAVEGALQVGEKLGVGLIEGRRRLVPTKNSQSSNDYAEVQLATDQRDEVRPRRNARMCPGHLSARSDWPRRTGLGARSQLRCGPAPATWLFTDSGQRRDLCQRPAVTHVWPAIDSNLPSLLCRKNVAHHSSLRLPWGFGSVQETPSPSLKRPAVSVQPPGLPAFWRYPFGPVSSKCPRSADAPRRVAVTRYTAQ